MSAHGGAAPAQHTYVCIVLCDVVPVTARNYLRNACYFAALCGIDVHVCVTDAPNAAAGVITQLVTSF
jgi:hypothetical protein